MEDEDDTGAEQVEQVKEAEEDDKDGDVEH
jgi:hypothetical protein